MQGFKQHIMKNRQRHLAVFIAFIVVMLTSCAFKGSIKSLAGIPVNTEQGQSKKSLVASEIDICVYGEVTDAKISTSRSDTNLLPLALVITAFFFLFGHDALASIFSHAGYGARKVHSSLPLFLQHRQLII